MPTSELDITQEVLNTGSWCVPWSTGRQRPRTVKNVARVQNEVSLWPEQRENHVAEREEANKDGEDAQRKLETLGSQA